MGLKQMIWEDTTATMMSVGRFCWNNGVSGIIVLIVRDKILWSDSYEDMFVRGVIR